MKPIVDLFGTVLITVSWLAGIVLAKGFWITTAAVIMPPYAWYLLIEYCMERL